MDTVCIEDIDRRIGVSTVKKPVSDALNATNLALNYYELAPGKSFAYGYHRHEKQEEVFVIQQGEVTFETESGDVVVRAGDAVRFAPGEYQQGVNTGDVRVVALAMGAPQDTGELDMRRQCDACGERTQNTIERVGDEPAKITRCLSCGAVTGRFE